MHGASGDGKPLGQRTARQFAVRLEEQEGREETVSFHKY
jgi:hypothetical protein